MRVPREVPQLRYRHSRKAKAVPARRISLTNCFLKRLQEISGTVRNYFPLRRKMTAGGSWEWAEPEKSVQSHGATVVAGATNVTPSRTEKYAVDDTRSSGDLMESGALGIAGADFRVGELPLEWRLGEPGGERDEPAAGEQAVERVLCRRFASKGKRIAVLSRWQLPIQVIILCHQLEEVALTALEIV
jgi:hypothetical protein